MGLQDAAAASPVEASLPEDDAESEADSEFESESADCLLRLSVMYQPEPLKTMGGAWRMRFAVPLPHSSQVWVVGASKPWRSSYVALQAGQWYS